MNKITYYLNEWYNFFSYINVRAKFFRWQHNYGYNNRRYGNPQQHNRKPSMNLNHIHNTHSHNNQFMITSHRNSISTPYLQNNQNQNMNNLNTNNLRVHTTEKRPSLQETSLQVRRSPLVWNLSFIKTNVISLRSLMYLEMYFTAIAKNVATHAQCAAGSFFGTVC